MKRSSFSKNKVKFEKGLTLQTLIVTIIVIMILAGVTITLSVGDNGVIKQTQKRCGSI